MQPFDLAVADDFSVHNSIILFLHAHLMLAMPQAIVCEFSPATASPMGLPWEVHERCRATLEASLLRDFFVHAARIAHSAAAPALQGRDDGLCLACVSLISAILGWEFRCWALLSL